MDRGTVADWLEEIGWVRGSRTNPFVAPANLFPSCSACSASLLPPSHAPHPTSELRLEAYHDMLALLGISGDLGVICLMSQPDMGTIVEACLEEGMRQEDARFLMESLL